jgi:hypothetical protein
MTEKGAPVEKIEKDEKMIVVATKAIDRLDKIKTDCENAVYTSVLRDRVTDMIDLMKIVLAAMAGQDVDLTLLDDPSCCVTVATSNGSNATYYVGQESQKVPSV